MVVIAFCIRRLPSLSFAEFTTYWREQHGPLVRSLAPDLLIRRYEQLHCPPGTATDILSRSRGATESFDGIAQLWFDNESDILAASQSEEGRRAARTLLEDERRFIDLARSAISVYEPVRVV